MTLLKRKKKVDYEHLYLRILEIGHSRLEKGLHFTELKEILEKEGYNFSNDCIELPIEQWFLESFESLPKYTDESFKQMGTNSYVLKGDNCLKYLEYKSSKNNLKVANIALWVAIIAAIISLISVIVSM